MILKQMSSLLSHLLPDWRQKTPENNTGKRASEERPCEACWAETSAHLDAVFSDALCLTGSEDDAADLVVEAYRRTFRGWFWEPRTVGAGSAETQNLLARLYRNLYAAFCDGVLACAARHEPSEKE